MGRRILITGVGSFMGTELARRLTADPDVEYVAGLDTRRPQREVEGLDLIEADIRNPLIAKLIPQARVDTVVHNQIVRQPGAGTSARQMHDINVMGSLQLLAACEQAETLTAIVIRGSAGIYGAEPAAPQFFTEEMARLYPLRTRFQRDVGEIENYFEAFSRRHPRVICTMLRYALSIGPTISSQVTRYLSQPLVPSYLGFDPRLQLVHEDDAIDALVAAARMPVRGAVNVAGTGTIGLTKMIRLARKASLPLAPPLFGPTVDAMRRLGAPALSPDFRRLLRFGRAIDTSRLAGELGARLRYSSEGAVLDWVEKQGSRKVAPSMRDMVAAR